MTSVTSGTFMNLSNDFQPNWFRPHPSTDAYNSFLPPMNSYASINTHEPNMVVDSGSGSMTSSTQTCYFTPMANGVNVPMCQYQPQSQFQPTYRSDHIAMNENSMHSLRSHSQTRAVVHDTQTPPPGSPTLSHSHSFSDPTFHNFSHPASQTSTSHSRPDMNTIYEHGLSSMPSAGGFVPPSSSTNVSMNTMNDTNTTNSTNSANSANTTPFNTSTVNWPVTEFNSDSFHSIPTSSFSAVLKDSEDTDELNNNDNAVRQARRSEFHLLRRHAAFLKALISANTPVANWIYSLPLESQLRILESLESSGRSLSDTSSFSDFLPRPSESFTPIHIDSDILTQFFGATSQAQNETLLLEYVPETPVVIPPKDIQTTSGSTPASLATYTSRKRSFRESCMDDTDPSDSSPIQSSSPFSALSPASRGGPEKQRKLARLGSDLHNISQLYSAELRRSASPRHFVSTSRR